MIFPERKLCGLNHNFYIHISVSDLYIPTIGLFFSLQESRWTDRGNIIIAHRYMNVEIGNEAALFLAGEYINRIFFVVCCTFFYKIQYEYQKGSIWCWLRIRMNSFLQLFKKAINEKAMKKLLVLFFQYKHFWGRKFALFSTDSYLITSFKSKRVKSLNLIVCTLFNHTSLNLEKTFQQCSQKIWYQYGEG
jgi:hypothetical protein